MQEAYYERCQEADYDPKEMRKMKHPYVDNRVNQEEDYTASSLDSMEQARQKRQRSRETKGVNKKLDGPNRPAE